MVTCDAIADFILPTMHLTRRVNTVSHAVKFPVVDTFIRVSDCTVS
jgi:hypothetical protein